MEVIDLLPRTLQQLIGNLSEQLLVKIPELAGLVRLTGQMTNPGEARGNWHYSVKITGEGGGQVKADLPVALVSKVGAVAGSTVRITGILKVDVGNYGLEVRLIAGDMEIVGGIVPAVPEEGRVSIEMLKSLSLKHFEFPPIRDLSISLIQSSSPNAQVAKDCLFELEKLGDAVRIESTRINMLDPAAIAKAIDRASGRIVILIRGGGDLADFEVFDNPHVVQSLAAKSAYRVVGLGHSGNSTLLDIVADFSANTPTQAGMHVREQVESRLRFQASIQKRIKVAEQERDQAARRASSDAKVTWWWLMVALMFGVIMGVIVG